MKVGLVAPAARVEESFLHTSEYLFARSGNNTGNFAFVQALVNHLSPEVEIIPWHVSPDYARERFDIIVMACANQLGPHTDMGAMAALLDKIGLPILAIGLGAQARDMETTVTLTDGTRKWIEVVAAHAPGSSPNIGVRGAFSLRQLESHGFADRAVITGCPSNLLNPDVSLPARLAGKFAEPKFDRIAVPGGLQTWPKLARIEEALADMVESTRGYYVVQSELDMIRIARREFDRIEPETLKAINRYIRPKLSEEEFILWCARYATCFIDAPSWMESMRGFDFVVGPRFHGVMLALQAGTPGGVIAHDSRTYEMCETMCIPVRHHSELEQGVTLDSLRSLFAFDADAYAQRRLELGRLYVQLLRAAGVIPAEPLRKLIENKDIAAQQAFA